MVTLLSVRDLGVRFDAFHGTVRAVAGVSFDLDEGEVLGLVGESGSGKSVTGLALLGLVPRPGVVDAGTALFRGRDLLALPPRELRRLRGSSIAMVFQDPLSSLNPLLPVGLQVAEVLEVHEGLPRREARRRAAAGLGEVGIPAPEAVLGRFPHELSGGMRQRVMIAMALVSRPALLVADEPTTALDVTTQAQVLELLADLRRRHGTAVLLVTHDLGVVAGMAERVAVMYAGRLVERGPTRALFRRPLHPYTAGLLASVPTLGGDPDAPLPTVEGQPPDPAARPPGCAFAPRCPLVVDRCRSERPLLETAAEGSVERASACFERERLGARPAAGRA